MAHEVKMPQMGESIAEGTVTTWLKKVGDAVARDEPLFEVATDKVDAEIPSPASGVLKAIRAEPGSVVAVGTIVALIEEAGAQPSERPAASEAPAASGPPIASPAAALTSVPAPAGRHPNAPAGAPTPAAQQEVKPAAAAQAVQADGAGDAGGAPHKSSPLVRRMAEVHGVDLLQVPGTGLGGRITKDDMQGYLDRPAGVPAASAGAAPAPAAKVAPASGSASPTGDEAYLPKPMGSDRVEPLGGMRSKIAAHMVASKRISPHVGTVWEMDFTHVGKLRAKYKKAWEEKYGVNLTYTSFIIKAATDALKEFPVINASLNGDKVYYHQSVNMGLAVALDWGLIVPVIKGADELNTLGLARRAADLAARARTKKLKPEEVQDGTFTITNPGSFGPMFNLPIINQPQVAILGVGTVEKRPVIVDDMIAIRTRAYLSLSFDHRLVDGAVADQFMARIKRGIESFEEGEL